MYENIYQLLEEKTELLMALTEALLDKETLNEHEIESIFVEYEL